MDDCEHLIELPEDLYSGNGEVVRTILQPWCKILDADILYGTESKPCPYSSKFCKVKQVDEEGKIYTSVFSEEEITNNVKL